MWLPAYGARGPLSSRNPLEFRAATTEVAFIIFEAVAQRGTISRNRLLAWGIPALCVLAGSFLSAICRPTGNGQLRLGTGVDLRDCAGDNCTGGRDRFTRLHDQW
jgi:hypothetical protein